MLKVGLTGGIGSGKSTIAKVFQALGIPVYNADDRARSIVNEDKDVQQRIIDLLGEASFKDGIYDRSFVASKVFKDADLLQKLNSIIHPSTVADFKQWLNEQDAPYILKEAAILFESGTNKGLDKVISVIAPEQLRIKRVQSRDNVEAEKVQERIKAQMTDAKREELSDYVILNDDQSFVLPQVLKLDKELRSL